jgi:hypothetical protein
LFLKSDVFGTTRTLNISTVIAILDTDFQDIAITGTAAPISGTRLGDCKGNSGITFPAPKTVYWGLNVTGNWNGTVWATTNGGAVNVNNFPLAQDTAVIPSGFPNSGQTVTINANYNIGTIDMSARTSNTMTLGTGTITPTIYGNWINGTGTTITGTGQIQFSGRGAQSITSAGKTFTQPFQFDSPSGTITLQDAFTTSATTSGAIKQNNGTIDLNGKTLTVSNTGAVTAWQTGTGTKNITFNGGTIVLAASGTTVFNNATPTGFTTTAGTGTGTISLTSAFAKTFVGGGSTFNCTLNQGGAGALTITGNNTFKDITNTYASTGATTITFTNVTTTTVSAFSAAGQATRLLTLNNATVAGTTAVIALSGGGTVATDYLNVQDMSFTPFATNGTAPYKWYAGANSTNSGNNSGILFAAATVTAYLLASGTSWTVPADWNNSNNTIHMIGGGGGGSSGSASGNNRAGGAGGGGGGYTAVNNFSTSPGASIAYQIGSGGITGNDGGNTTWNSGAYTAGGGKKGTQSTAPLSTGGAGGTGTYAGGDGGAGAYGTAASTGYGGGGGGGAGGPNGKGGNGGLGVSTTSNATLAGGGGGGNGGGSNGGNASSGAGGNGGNNFNGTGGGVGTVGSFGGGGAGAVNGSTGLRGGLGIDILNTVGGGGGAGGSGYSTGGSSFSISAYGSGGGASGVNITGGFGTGGNGAQGMIFIIYTPDAGGGFSVGTANFFAFF